MTKQNYTIPEKLNCEEKISGDAFWENIDHEPVKQSLNCDVFFSGDGHVSGHAQVFDNARVFGNALVYGVDHVYGISFMPED